ncbi:hypothetical protein WICPIJ_000745 [Wickerhamomyces pijperi]|uniref:Uncharacterized protein n=1 Tax=Wickerhamomyces pijperi TaxID=599730 RepID=A0A9P8QFQ1_WICPI|nr:hypothetical protein WICPIJ_000745 [Wickerhamomyces pijperi]
MKAPTKTNPAPKDPVTDNWLSKSHKLSSKLTNFLKSRTTDTVKAVVFPANMLAPRTQKNWVNTFNNKYTNCLGTEMNPKLKVSGYAINSLNSDTNLGEIKRKIGRPKRWE